MRVGDARDAARTGNVARLSEDRSAVLDRPARSFVDILDREVRDPARSIRVAV